MAAAGPGRGVSVASDGVFDGVNTMVADSSVDVAVIGAGVAGVAATIEAAARGATVALIDMARSIGGTAAISGGGTCIAGSPLQRRLGIKDSPELALNDWLAFGGPSADEDWARRYLNASVPEVYDFLARRGVHWYEVRPQEGNTVARWHAPRGGGRRVMELLAGEVATDPRVTFLGGHRARELTRSGRAVTGVIIDGPSRSHHINATSVVLATGGFCSDSALIAEHGSIGPAARPPLLLAGGPRATGEGHRLAAEVGARLVNLDAIWAYPHATPDPASPAHRRGLVLRGLDGDIWVNRHGNRFFDESLRGGATGAAALRAQPGSIAWSIIDGPIAERLIVADPAYRRDGEPDRAAINRLLAESPHIVRAGHIAGLAHAIGVAPDRLVATVESHNDVRRSGSSVDPQFGRDLSGLTPLAEAPFYAIGLRLAARKSLGGVQTDEHCRVLADDGSVIDGLFAAGEVAGMAGGHINGTAALEGTMFGPSLFAGRIAGSRVPLAGGEPGTRAGTPTTEVVSAGVSARPGSIRGHRSLR